MTNAQMILKQDNTKNDRLYIAFELSNTKWKLMFGNGIKRRQITIDARNLNSLEQEILKAKSRFKMAEDVEIYSCYSVVYLYLNCFVCHFLMIECINE